jgi:hypothetical protein
VHCTSLVFYRLTDAAQITRSAREHDEEQCNIFQAEVGEHYPPQTLVFLDKAACNQHTSKQSKAWALKGDHARQHDFFVQGTRYVSVAISHYTI